MKQFLLGLTILFVVPYSYCQHVLTIVIHDIPSDKGNIMLAVYNKSDGFMEKDKTYLNRIIPSVKGTMRCELTNIIQGNYAIAVYHDSNANGKLDKNMFGIPTEYYGFSNDARGRFGPPSFKDCEINLSGTKEIQVHLH